MCFQETAISKIKKSSRKNEQEKTISTEELLHVYL